MVTHKQHPLVPLELGITGRTSKNPRTNGEISKNGPTRFLEKRKDWDPKEERREIKPRWPGVYETEEDSVGSCAAL